ncbi:MAG TPA: formamidase [Porticoccaceae bacterium]|nr:formamidase [Porticoccaceae bacterium]
MPVYDYKCPEHGVFSELETMDNYARPSPCPRCGDLAGRVIIVAPDALTMNPFQREVCIRNERSQHQPRVFAAGVEAEKHGSKPCPRDGGTRERSKALYTATGEKLFPSARPWMLSH